MKGKYLIFSLILTIIFIPKIVLASGNISVSPTDIEISQGSSSSFKITANNAAGAISITSSNPDIASVSVENIFLDMETQKISITGKKAGTTIITVYNQDVTTYDDENITGKSLKINVTVKNSSSKGSSKSTKAKSKTTTKNNTSSSNSSNTSEVTDNSNLSSNNKLKSLVVDGQEVTKVDNNTYTLTVPYNTTNINIKATAVDGKAIIKGAGAHNLKVGQNVIKITVTSESGEKNNITLTVTRETEKEAKKTSSETPKVEKKKNYVVIIELGIIGLLLICISSFAIKKRNNKGKN